MSVVQPLMYPKTSDDTRPDPDYCPVCKQHYDDGCAEDCQEAAERQHRSRVEDGESFRGDEAAAYRRALELDVVAGEK